MASQTKTKTLDAIDPRLKNAILGRCGYLARVTMGGTLRTGEGIRIERDRSQ